MAEIDFKRLFSAVPKIVQKIEEHLYLLAETAASLSVAQNIQNKSTVVEAGDAIPESVPIASIVGGKSEGSLQGMVQVGSRTDTAQIEGDTAGSGFHEKFSFRDRKFSLV